MNSIFGFMRKREAGITALVFVYMSMALAPAYASDTEVYARKKTVAGDNAPVMMFMLDNSGSMTNCVSSSSGCGATNADSRVATLKRVMQKVLIGDATFSPIPGTVKVGYSRYINSGTSTQSRGVIMLPARPLDSFVAINPLGDVTSSVAASADDAEQQAVIDPPTDAGNASGAQDVASTTLNFGFEDTRVKQNVGLRFAGVQVPKNASIISARIELTAKVTSSATAPVWQIQSEASDDAAAYSASSQINARTYTSPLNTMYPDAWTKDSVYSVDVTNLIESVTSRSGWCGGNAMAFRVMDISGVLSGSVSPVDAATLARKAYSYDDTPAKAPRLVVNYTVNPTDTNSCMKVDRTLSIPVTSGGDDVEWYEGGAKSSYVISNNQLSFMKISGTTRNQAAMRFASVALPKGGTGTLEQADLVLQGYTAGSATDPDAEVRAFAVDDMPAICTSTRTSSCSTLPATLSSAAATFSPKNIAANTEKRIDVRTVVNEIISRSGWVEKNDLGLVLRSTSTSVANSKNTAVYAFNGSSSKAPRLELKMTGIVITDLSKFQTVRQELNAAIQASSANTSTPLGEALAETAAYMLDKPVFVPDSIDSSKNTAQTYYKSPVAANSCAANHIFLLTDGEPSNDPLVLTGSKNVMGHDCSATLIASAKDTANKNSWGCMFDVAKYISTPSLNNKQSTVNVSTMVLGPDTGAAADLDFKRVAAEGGGSAYTATDEQSLLDGIVATVNKTLEASGTVSAPGVSVNQFNRTQTLDRLYYSVFKPRVNKTHWTGNLKRYKLDIANVDVLDKNGAPAVDGKTSFFKPSSSSYWSTADGDNASVGGAANQLPLPDTRKLFTYLGTYPTAPVSSLTSLVAVDETNATFQTNAMAAMGISSVPLFKNIINWLQGYALDKTQVNSGTAVAVTSASAKRYELGGALHASPLLVNYGFTGSTVADKLAAEKDADLQDNTIYFSTMEGILHAVDATTGVERFAFIPKENLARVQKLINDPDVTVPEFGLDLTWSVYRFDKNGDGKIDAASGDRVMLYGGMRMGGSNYYALDVTDRDNPKIAFVIEGGKKVGSNDFTQLGQTWSQPTQGFIKIAGVLKNVLVFGGGYDVKHENIGYSSPSSDSDSIGNAIYIVDSFTGQLYWWASASGTPTLTVPAMKFAIPSAIKLKSVDLSTGLTSALYFGDLGGQVFRIDLDNKNTAASKLVPTVSNVKLFASLGQTVTANEANQRRFYEPPGVVTLKDSVSGLYYVMVAMGSGYRSHPLDEGTKDYFYVMRDDDVLRSDVLTASGLQATITPSSLAALNLASAAGATLTGKKGYYVPLVDSGEKVMARPVIVSNGSATDGKMLFTTYVPTVVGGTTCQPVVGRSKIYVMGVAGGAAIQNGFTQANVTLGPVSNSGRTTDSVIYGMAPVPVIAVGSDGKKVIVVGTTILGDGTATGGGLKRVRWYPKLLNE